MPTYLILLLVSGGIFAFAFAFVADLIIKELRHIVDRMPISPNPYRIVQLMAWRDETLALTETGDIYVVRVAYNGQDPVIELLMYNPIHPF
jgi:hypothetical protein